MKKFSSNLWKRGAKCKMATINETPTLTFDEIRSLFKWKLELVKVRVVCCLNRSWIHNSYHSLRTV